MTAPRRALLFRYHDRLDICRDRLALIRRLNPGVPVWGMYGGAEPDTPRGLDLDDDYALPFADARFKWEHGDLCVRDWFKNRGQAFTFDMLHVIEWDLILLKSVETLFAPMKDGIALSDTDTLATLRDKGWGWITHPQRQEQFRELSALIQERHGVTLDPDTLRVGVFPGASMSRAFLESYAAEEIPVLLHDEIRPAAFAAAYGMTVQDTGLRRRTKLWNCNKDYYTPEQLYEAAASSDVFHPVKDALDTERFLALTETGV